MTSSSQAPPGRRRADDRGTVLLLVVGLAAVAIGLVITVSDVTALYLGRRAVAAAADATAIAGAQGADLAAIYAGRATTDLPLSTTAVRAAVTKFVADAGLSASLHGFRVDSVTSDVRSVRVVVSAEVRLPFVGLVHGSAVRVSAAARAVAPLR